MKQHGKCCRGVQGGSHRYRCRRSSGGCDRLHAVSPQGGSKEKEGSKKEQRLQLLFPGPRREQSNRQQSDCQGHPDPDRNARPRQAAHQRQEPHLITSGRAGGGGGKRRVAVATVAIRRPLTCLMRASRLCSTVRGSAMYDLLQGSSMRLNDGPGSRGDVIALG